MSHTFLFYTRKKIDFSNILLKLDFYLLSTIKIKNISPPSTPLHHYPAAASLSPSQTPTTPTTQAKEEKRTSSKGNLQYPSTLVGAQVDFKSQRLLVKIKNRKQLFSNHKVQNPHQNREEIKSNSR